MTTTVKSYAAFDPESSLGAWDLERRVTEPKDVAIEIRYCGVCHSDLHSAKNHWGSTRYPLSARP